MSPLFLQILEPANEANFLGTGSVRMRGGLGAPAPGPLFFQWYSSLEGKLLEPPWPAPPDFVATLKVGTHILTFTAMDVPGKSAADFAAVQHAGFAGGPPQLSGGCLINVLLADIHTPVAGATLSKSNSTLGAVAPALWGNPGYHKINRVRFVWVFTPAGIPAGPHSPRLAPEPGEMSFELKGSTPLVQYQGALPASLGSGNHTLILRLEDIKNPAVGHEASVNIVLID